jgi:aminoglycoside phosphotransferase (APT) family kinase protein
MSGEQVLTPALVAAIVAAQFADLVPVRAAWLGEGCDSAAFLVNDRLVFRFPKRDEVEPQVVREIRLLPFIAFRTSVPVPVYSHVGRPSPLFPRHFGAYPLLPGVPALQVSAADLDPVSLAVPLSDLFNGLHTWDRLNAEEHGIPETHVGVLIEEVRTDALDDFDLVAAADPRAPLERWRAYMADPPVTEADASCVVHGDFAAEHVLYDREQRSVTGVIDWSELAIADPAVDFAGLYHWGGEPLVAAVLSRYAGPRPGAGVLQRARYLAVCRGVADIRFGRDAGRPEYIRGGLRALRHCLGDSR